VPGTSTALETLESSFHQDLNGDGVVGVVATVSAGAMLEFAGADLGLVTFSGQTGLLKLGNPSGFSGQIAGFTGDGTLAGSDQIDLRGITYGSIHSTYDTSTGILAVDDGTNSASLHFKGSYSLANFKFADDGSGGTIVYDPPTPSQLMHEGNDVAAPIGTASLANTFAAAAGEDAFVFAANLGDATIANYTPAADIQINPAGFADINASLAAAHDHSPDNAVITDAEEYGTLPLQHVVTAPIPASDFHLV
jgi:serralysin